MRIVEGVALTAGTLVVVAVVLACKPGNATRDVDASSAPTRVATESTASTATVGTSRYKMGDAVTVEWKGKNYPATIIEVLPAERYTIHYIAFEDSWDETVGLDRIVGRR